MNDGENLSGGKVGECKIVRGRESDDVAFARDSFGPE